MSLALVMELGVVPALWVALQAGWARGAMAAARAEHGGHRAGLDAAGRSARKRACAAATARQGSGHDEGGRFGGRVPALPDHPAAAGPPAFRETLAAALDAGDVACLQLRLKDASPDDVKRAIDALMPVATRATSPSS